MAPATSSRPSLLAITASSPNRGAGAETVRQRPAARSNTGTWRVYPAWLGWLVMALVLRALLSANFQSATSPQSAIKGWDFQIVYLAAMRLNNGQSLYGPDNSSSSPSSAYLYTPLLAEALRPLATFSYETALRLWFFATSLALLAAVWLYTRAAGLSLRNTMPVTLLMVTALHFWPVTLDQDLGNINGVLLACVCGMLLSARTENDTGVAIWIALAALLKTWMIGLLLYLVLRRAWRALSISLGLAGAGAVLLFAALPSGQFSRFIASNRQMAAQSDQVSQSILGAASRHLAPNPLVTPLVDNRAAFLLANALGALAVCGGMLAMWKAGPRLDPYREQLRLGLVMSSILLVIPVSYQVYHVFDLALIWTLLLPSKPMRHALTAGALALGCYLLLTLRWPTMTPLPDYVRHGVATLETSAGLFLRLGLWALGLTALLVWSRDLRSPHGSLSTREADEAQLGMLDVDYGCE